MLVKDGCSNHNDSSSNSRLEKYRMVKNDEDRVGARGTPEVEGQVKGSNAQNGDRVTQRIWKRREPQGI